jgi:hypothetical protein
MVTQAQKKHERIVEAVRLGLDGEAAVDFVRQSGFALTTTGIARHLRKMGGRGNIVALINEGHSNWEILQAAYPEERFEHLTVLPPSQGDLFSDNSPKVPDNLLPFQDLFQSTKITLTLPNDLLEAIRLAARAEKTTRSQLIIDILTSAMSRVPEWPQGDGE